MKKIIFVSLIFIGFGYFNLAWAEKACFEVQGMTCATCPITVRAAVKKLKGINDIKASLEEKNAVVEFDSQKTNTAQIKKAIDDVGYKAIPQECKKIKDKG
ncbi:MAG: cation transporter [Pseudomonadota bacterium]|nr:cation transporter [Pseudomonadota bacterium]